MARMTALTGGIRRCFVDEGVAQITFTVDGPTGRVTQVGVASGPTEDAKCLVRAVAQTCFVPFRSSRFLVSFPYKLD
jgi:hypothetical protein